ncbi:phage tail protein [Enterococcus faecalis]|nr:phage tail protein [Enterococcus faecalis]
MVDTFKIYKGEDEIVSGPSPLAITGLEPDTAVPAGEYQATRVSNDKESDRVDIPAFKTLPIAVTGLSISPKNSTAEAGTAGSRQLTATVSPENATNKKVGYTITPETAGLEVSNSGNITWTADVPAGEYITTGTTEDGNFTDSNTLTLTTP